MKELKLQVTVSKDNFWNALKIYYDHPNCINKQILICQHIYSGEIKDLCGEQEFKILYEKFCTCLTEKQSNFDIHKNLPNLVEIKNSDVNNIFSLSEGIYLFLRKLIPKKNLESNDYYEFLFLDKKISKVCIYTKCIRNTNCDLNIDVLNVLKYNYLEVIHNKESIEVLYENDLNEKGINWLNAIFMLKLKNIMFNIQRNSCNNSNKMTNKLLFTSTVDVINYYKLYEKMKLKYAKYLIENWTENTDPKKFVFEDIGIATYLMLLWNDKNQEKVNKQKFIDLGCGNGLLVHILNSEGHCGVGLDLRKRKIWKTYPSSTVLKEQAVIPTTDVYPEADWLIGNHSDELTAWIPILARRSNNHCQYFVLPCCPYQLNGQKFQRKNSSLSSYHDFINHVKEISELCHFETFVDRLRIPSTKKICLIGLRNPCKKEENDLVNEKVINYVNDNYFQSPHEICKNFEEQKLINCPVVNNHLYLFHPKIRDSTEKVKNCTKISSNLIDKILKNIMEVLIMEKCDVEIVKNGLPSTWNQGKKLPIKELAQKINKKFLTELKKECKGLQTMLKNHHYIFDVSQGCAQFRSPEGLLKISNQLKERGDKIKWKKRSCWFFKNHPDKCPLLDEMCSYSHE